jgi:ech hydrogenase subunit B
VSVFLKVIVVLIASPLVGGLLAGLDRILSARMQRRKGPPIWQPFYDVSKLFQKRSTSVDSTTFLYALLSLLLTLLTVVLLFVLNDLLLCIFVMMLSCVFFVIIGYASHSPYSFIGAERELVQIMCYEPMTLITAFGLYMATGTFDLEVLFTLDLPVVAKLPFIFVGLLFVLTIKLRKSPFDMSTSHHAHQELVKGLTTEINGVTLGLIEISHWVETVFALALVYLFFLWSSANSLWIAAVITLGVFFMEIVIDNITARIKWRKALEVSWIVTAVVAVANFLLLQFL